MLTPDEIREVYAAAARWCDSRGYRLESVSYFEKAGDYGGLAETAYSLTRMTPTRVALFLLDTIDRIPESAFGTNPELYIIKIKILQSLARFEEASSLSRAVIERFECLSATPENCWVLSECHLNLGYIGIFTALHTNVRDHSESFEKGYRYFKLSGGMSRGSRERALIGAYVSRVGHPAAAGDIKRSIEEFSRYVGYAIAAKNGMMRGAVDLAECEAAYFKGDIKRAEGFAYQAASKAHESEQFQIENRALLFLLRIHIHSGNTGGLGDVLRRLEAQLDNAEFIDGYTLYDIACGWYHSQLRQSDHVADWLRSGLEEVEFNELTNGLETLVRAKCLFAEKKYYAALAALEGQDGEYGLESFLIGKLEIAAMRSVCVYHTGDRAGALRALEDAYRVSSSEELDMPFIELGRDMRTLTASAMKSDAVSIPAQWLDKMHKKSSAYAKSLSYVIADFRNRNNLNDKLFELTSKEKEILTDLCHGLSRTEIAYSRGISANAVKLLLRSIYTKLGAQNTADAVWTAARLNLIS
jgi:LuxR family maltose regulon positive regulatory protein